MSAALQMEQMDLVARHFVHASLMDNIPVSESAAEAIASLVEDFDLLEDWTERYQHIIDLGKKLPVMPAEWKVADHLLHGCQSQVWLVTVMEAGRLYIYAQSDSAIVGGLIAILRRVYNGRSPSEILATDPTFLQQLGLNDHLSPTRRNGLHAMLQAIRTIAATMEKAND